ncbi:sulfotransferase [Methylocapsa sp. S129]|uniref:sulfotransferase family protein n=1 Tax=Methylocapsa sp. S129 TaxID=1641869 RepID=UPI001FF0387B|nr:sulfotransferase [Methylocapsa sp. S129]
MRLAPTRARSYHHLALAKRFEPGDSRIQAMEELVREDTSLGVDDRVYVHFALGKAFDDIGNRERSFHHLSCGNALKRKQSGYNERDVLGQLERTQVAYTSELMSRNEARGNPSPVPIFVVGMPRSGTTLVEQILASHSDVHGAGEIKDFDMAVRELGGSAAWALHSPEVVSQMSGEQFQSLGANYLRRILAAAPSSRRIVNKMTENFRFAGLIALALPNARIIHVRRDPIDTCFSCFSALFEESLPYAYDLAELGRYYRAYEALMSFWRGVLPQRVMIDVRYEDVVADVEGQSRRIIGHCGLDWDARCLDFHLSERSVRTASLVQVRRPLYKSSVGRWRRYEDFLEPLFASLASSTGSADSVLF